jgi:hypothetical protein
MTRIILYQTVTGETRGYVAKKPGPKSLPDECKKRVVSFRLYPATIARIDRAAQAKGMTRTDWIEAIVLDGLRNT